LIEQLDEKREVDSTVGSSLSTLFHRAGLKAARNSSEEVLARTVEQRKFWAITVREAASGIVQAGVATESEISALCGELEHIARNATIQVMLTKVFRASALNSSIAPLD
jgi:hypothetical protein